MSHYTIVVPVKPKDNIWSFLHPLAYQVWIGILISIPMFILSMGLANYFFYKYIDWGIVVDFVLRVAMVDERPIQSFILKMKYQKIMAIVWMWALFILSQAYAGNLTAMLTRPILEKTIHNIEDLLNQTDIKWSLEDSGTEIFEYFKVSSPGSTMRGLLDKAETGIEWETEDIYSPCYTSEQRNARTWASICDVTSIDQTKSRDFSDTGKCNYYTIEDTFFTTPAVMAFQVGQDHVIPPFNL